MPIRVECPKCKKPLDVPESFIGQDGQCPGCNTVVHFYAPKPVPTEKPAVPAAVAPIAAVPTSAVGTPPKQRTLLSGIRKRLIHAITALPPPPRPRPAPVPPTYEQRMERIARNSEDHLQYIRTYAGCLLAVIIAIAVLAFFAGISIEDRIHRTY